MEAIKAFVAHSFTADDSNVVTAILKCLDRVAELHPRFSWQHAEHPEPIAVDEKVLSLFADKNLFIGICTKKERVISPSALSPCWLTKRKLTAKEVEFQWKTSDWIIQEIGLAIGREMKIILLLEEGMKYPGALQGNLEHVEFNRNVPEKCFDKLLGMIAALSPVSGISSTVAHEGSPQSAQEGGAIQPPADNYWTTPKPEWTVGHYELALWFCIRKGDESAEKRIEALFFASDVGGTDVARKEWAAHAESLRILFGRGDLARLERLSAESPDSSEIAADLASSYLHYKEYNKAAKAYELAADTAKDARRQIELLGNSALYHMKAGNEPEALALESRMRKRCDETGQGEVELLNSEKNLAEERKEHEIEIAALERLIEINPGDIDIRFSLAYKYSNVGRDELAAFHYSRIPAQSRTGIAWNNLGVSLERLGLPIQSIEAYRESEKLGETLAMSNLAIRFLNAGFLPEAQGVLDFALKIENHNKNVDESLGTAKDAHETESSKGAANDEKATPVSEYYRQFGRSLTKVLNASIIGRWKGPNCLLDFTINGTSLVATGSYDAKGLGLLMANPYRTNDPTPTRHVVEYKGIVRGLTIVGSVSRRQEDQASPKVSSTLLGGAEANPVVLMWIESTSDRIHVLERSANAESRFYEFQRV